MTTAAYSICALLLLGSCATESVRGDRIDVRGDLTAVTPRQNGDIVGTVRIEGVKEKDTGYDKASLNVTGATKIYMLDGTDRLAVTYDSLRVGQRVEATFTDGPVMESYPVQATAAVITILSR